MLRPLKKTYRYECRECREPFDTQHKPTVCCSRACGLAWGKRNADATRKANASARNARVCQQCGVSFQRKRNSLGLFCSRVCRGENARVYETKQAARKAMRQRELERKGPPIDRRTNVFFGPKPAKPEREPITPIECTVCELEFMPSDRRKRRFCGVDCYRRANRMKRLDTGKSALERAKWLGIEYEEINPFKVFVAANWLCQICGIETPRILRGTTAGNAPELDHIHPTSKGGAHTYANVQLACRRCNGRKGNRITCV